MRWRISCGTNWDVSINENPKAIIDSFPIPTCRFARARFSRLFRGIAAYGKEIGNQTFYGLRLHTKINSLGMIQTFELAAANVHDIKMLPELTRDRHLARAESLKSDIYGPFLLTASQIEPGAKSGPLRGICAPIDKRRENFLQLRAFGLILPQNC